MADWLHRKERIVYTAIEVMHEYGVQALSTKKISEYEAISESTVFKHYPSKTELFTAVLDFYAKYDRDVMASIVQKKIKGKDAIRYFVETYSTYFENYPAITVIVQGLREMRFIQGLEEHIDAIEAFKRSSLKRMVIEAKEGSTFACDIDSDLLVDVLNSVVEGIVGRWRIEKYSFALKERLLEAVNYCIKD